MNWTEAHLLGDIEAMEEVMMIEAPERIWAHPTERQPVPSKERKNSKWLRGKWKDHDSSAHGDVEYIRADLVEAAVKRALEGAAEKTALMPMEIPPSPRLAYHAALEAVDAHIRALDPAQFIDGGSDE